MYDTYLLTYLLIAGKTHWQRQGKTVEAPGLLAQTPKKNWINNT